MKVKIFIPGVMKSWFVFFGCMLTLQGVSQTSVQVKVSSDTVAMGQQVEVTYTIENGNGKFNFPDMHNLPVISGPNSSSSFLYQNGSVTSSQSYSFLLLPVETGKLVIPGASYQAGNEILAIEPVEIVVLKETEDLLLSKPKTESSSSRSTREKKKI